MNVKKIFVILITVVVCVVIGAFVINILAPNATNGLIGAIETQMQNAAGISFDMNGDGTIGTSAVKTNNDRQSKTRGGSDAVTGFN